MRLRTSPFLTDVLLTTVTSIASSAAVLISMRLFAQGLGQTGFGTFSISRRVLAMLVPLTSLTMGMALPRYVAVARDREGAGVLLAAGTVLGIVPALLICAGGIVLAAPLATLMFRDRAEVGAVTATLVAAVGYSAYLVVYGYYRGRGMVNRANLLQLVIIALGPVAVAAIFAARESVATVLFWLAGVFLISFMPLAHLWLTEVGPAKLRDVLSGSRELFEYGAPRIGMGMLFGAIFAVGPLLAPHVGTIEDAGYIAAGQAVISLASTAISAFTVVSLPKVAQLVSEGRTDFLRDRVTDLVVLVVHLGLFSAVQLLVWSDLLTTAWLGIEYTPAIPLMQILILSVVPYSAFELLRSVIDALEKRPVNTLNLAKALAVTATVSVGSALAGLGVKGLAAGAAIGMLYLGAVTVRYLHTTGWLGTVRLRWPQFIAANALLAGVALSSRSWVLSASSPGISVIRALAIEAFLFAVYWMVLRRLDVEWVRQIEERVVHRAASAQ